MKNKLILILLSSTILLFNSCKKEDEKEETPPVSPPVTTASVMCNPSGSNPIASNSIKAVINGDTFNFPFTYGYLYQGDYVDLSGLHNRNFLTPQVYPHLFIGFSDTLALGNYDLGLPNTPITFLTCTLSSAGPIYTAKSGMFELMFNDTAARVVGGKFRTLMVDDPNNPTDSIKVCGEFLKTLTKI